jgi:hypothetical protein
MTGADREWAARYQPGDVLKYTTGSKLYGIERNSPAIVASVDGQANTITVAREDGVTVTYDPKRLKGANVYQEVAREFATGDRIQFTASDKALGTNNRGLATIAKMDGNITVQMDGKDGRVVMCERRSKTRPQNAAGAVFCGGVKVVHRRSLVS